MSGPRSTATGLLVALGLAVAGCGTSATPEPEGQTPVTTPATSPATGPATATPTSDSSTAPVPAVLQFTGTTVSGDAFKGSSLAGKPVVLWFWAPWCAVCRSQAPKVSAMVAKYGDRLSVVGVGSLDSSGAIADFADEVDGPIQLSDPKGALWKRFRIAEQSSFVVLDATGKVVLRTGYNDDGDLARTVAGVVS